MEPTLINAYITYTLEHNAAPANVYVFAKFANTTEQAFYEHYSGLEALEKAIYATWLNQAYDQCSQSEPWQGYSTREKLLSLFYTFIETVKPNRTFAVFLKNRDTVKLPKWPAYLSGLHNRFLELVKPIVQEGIINKEFAERKWLDERYADGLWLNFLFVLTFWLNDQSAGFEKTDAAIEKSVNLATDLIGKGPLDAALDFGKFLFQQKAGK
jgi:AcrR family transcriptional regulator